MPIAIWDDVLTATWDDLLTAWDSAPIEGPTHLVWLYDYAGTQKMVLHELLALETDDRLQDSETLRFTIAADDPKAIHVLGDTICRYRKRYYRITAPTPTRDGTRAVIDVEAEALWNDLAGYLRPGSFFIAAETVASGAALMLADTTWTVSDDTIVTAADYALDQSDLTVLGLLRAWAKVTNTEIVFDTEARTVAFVAQQGATQDIGFRYGLNLRGIKRRWIPPAATRLYAYGRAGLTIEGPNPTGFTYIEDYSFYTGQGLLASAAREEYRRDLTWVDDAFVSDQPLYDAAVARLARLAQPTIAYEASVADLAAATDTPFGRYRLGDVVPVRDTVLDVDVRTRIVRLVRHPLNPSDTQIELSYLQGPPLDQSQLGRFSDAREWLLFIADPNAARVLDFRLAILSDLGLKFVAGEAIFHVDVTGTTTGTGTLRLTLYDEVSDTVIGPEWDVVFTTGQELHEVATFSLNELNGDYLFTVRADVVSGTGTVAVAAGDSRFSILTRGALGVTIPPEPDSVTFAYNGTTGANGSAQTWEVPAGVNTAVIDCYGAEGVDASTGLGGRGGRIRARVDVIAGETLEVRVGGRPFGGGAADSAGGFNGGGNGGPASNGQGGGGASDVRRTPYGLADRLVVAGGGGGGGRRDPPGTDYLGGDGGYPAGGSGPGFWGTATGGTQSDGGDGAGSMAGTGNGSLGQGGNNEDGGAGGSGGGGGLYGGGGAEGPGASGGGSSGTPDPTATEILAEDGAREGHGVVVISWDTPT